LKNQVIPIFNQKSNLITDEKNLSMNYDDPQSSWGSTNPPSIVRVRLSAVQLWQAGRTGKYMV